MSLRYKGGVISATPPTTTGGDAGTATGVWTLEQQLQAKAAGNWPNQPPPVYIEDVFSIYVYNGSGSGSQTITNGINLSGKGGMVWGKVRTNIDSHYIFDTNRGVNQGLNSNTTDAQGDSGLTAFNSDGFSVDSNLDSTNSARKFVTWTFRKQAKFFDVQTWTGTGTSGRQVSHNLASVPGCVIIKSTNTAGEPWYVYHRSVGASGNLLLNSTDAVSSPSSEPFDGVAPTATYITLPSYNGVNGSGKTYVGYFFAHDAGGFGPLGTDSVISCGSLTTDGSGYASVNLGWEPQIIIVKKTSSTGNWIMYDNIRGWNLTDEDRYLFANSSTSEATYPGGNPTATGFDLVDGASSSYVYIAIRRGPMKTPTSGEDIYKGITWTGSNSARIITGLSWPLDMCFTHIRNYGGTSLQSLFFDRERGATESSAKRLAGTSTNGETNYTAVGNYDLMNGLRILDGDSLINDAGIPSTYIGYFFRRAPGFFDVVCYTGTGSATTQAHNLGVAPELIITKRRSSANSWLTYSATLGIDKYLTVETTDGSSTATGIWGANAPTSTVFSLPASYANNSNGSTYVAYLFASVSGVSKVGSYTGTGALQTIDCGFTTGARFVLIKRTDSTGGWYIYDSARGISSSDDPYFFMNSVAAEVTNTNYVDTDTTGFKVTAAAPSALNANGGTFIFLAIA